MMKKPRARLCKQYAALPQRELWGGGVPPCSPSLELCALGLWDGAGFNPRNM